MLTIFLYICIIKFMLYTRYGFKKYDIICAMYVISIFLVISILNILNINDAEIFFGDWIIVYYCIFC